MHAALALALLAGPPEFPDPPPGPDEFAGVAAAVRGLAVELEIMDPREVRYLMIQAADWGNDLTLLRRRYQELKDAPKMCDALRFPDRDSVTERLAFNRSYRRHLSGAAPLYEDRGDLVRAVLKETDMLYSAYDAVRDAQCEYYYVSCRRQALARLRGLIGKDAFAAGEMPPAVPLWRFQETN